MAGSAEPAGLVACETTFRLAEREIEIVHDELIANRQERRSAMYEDLEQLTAIGPHRAADRLNRPTTIVAGVKDFRCPEPPGNRHPHRTAALPRFPASPSLS